MSGMYNQTKEKSPTRVILVTGGAGYIGSHVAWKLHQSGYRVIIIDSLVYNQPWPHSWATFIKGDIGDRVFLNSVFSLYVIEAVMHFAAFIEVGRSVYDPSVCFKNNVTNVLTLLDAMVAHHVKTIIFSSSCAVYGEPQQIFLTEDHPRNPISPYGQSKFMTELILTSYAHAYGIRYVALRYFNAAGALPEQGLGECHEPETHVIPLALRAAIYDTPFMVFGLDHSTPDGTCVRDYLHVFDIACAHLKSLEYLMSGNSSNYFNLGTGNGFSVQELVHAVQLLTKKKLFIKYQPKRVGDPAVLVADPRKAQVILGWQPQHSSLRDILQSAYNFELLVHGKENQKECSVLV